MTYLLFYLACFFVRSLLLLVVFCLFVFLFSFTSQNTLRGIDTQESEILI